LWLWHWAHWFGEQVAGDLLHEELAVGHVAVESVDHPVSPGPHLPHLILFVAVGVGVAGEVEPVAGPLLAVAGACLADFVRACPSSAARSIARMREPIARLRTPASCS
jgi:hypothetical protein